MKLSLGLGRDHTRIFVGMLFNEGSLGIYQTLWPLYIASLGAAPEQIGLVIGLLGAARLVALLPSGMLGDRVPARTLIVGGRLAVAVGTLLLGLAQAWWQLIPGVIIIGVGTITFPALSNAVAELAHDSHERTRAFTLIYTIGPSAAWFVTPTIGGLIAEHVSLRALLFVASGLAAICAAIFATIAAGAATTQEGPPVTYRSTLAERPVRQVLLLQFVTLFVLTMGVTLAPNFLQDVHAISRERIGWLGSCAAVGSALLGLTISRVARFRRPLTGIALATTAVGGTLLLLLVGHSFAWFVFAYLLRGGYMVAWSTYYAALGEVTPNRYLARVYALAELLAAAGLMLAPFAAGWLYEREPRAPLLVALLAIPVLLLAIVAVGRRLRVAQPAEPTLAGEQA
ncbi:MAG: MFS transporter [Sphaerobacter sp.]|nr:MFS transporter [Sphaerobacter sp.]